MAGDEMGTAWERYSLCLLAINRFELSGLVQSCNGIALLLKYLCGSQLKRHFEYKVAT
jgi:hypothetical protein